MMVEAASIVTEVAIWASRLPQLFSRLCQETKLATDVGYQLLQSRDSVRSLQASVKALQVACLRLHDAWEGVAARLRDLVGFGTLSRPVLEGLVASLGVETQTAIECEAAAAAAVAELRTLRATSEILRECSESLSAMADQLSPCGDQLRTRAASLWRLARSVPNRGGAPRLPPDAAAELRLLLSCSGCAEVENSREVEAEVDLLSGLRVAEQTAVNAVKG